MDRQVAIRKLTKILGKSLGYRVDPTAPTKDQRDEAKAALIPAIEKRKAIGQKRDERYRAILAADPEYQSLAAAYKEASAEVDRLAAITRHFKMTVGVVNDLFFSVRAEGDSWEEILATLERKAARGDVR